jgi:xylose isomerase
MAGLIFKKDDVKTITAHEGENGLILNTSQDVTAILEDNARKRNQTDRRTKWGGELFDNKIASIPMAVFDELHKQGITRGFHVLDQKRFREWLNNPDNRFFRTREGKV